MGEEMDRDAALMLRVRQGDSAAFSELVDKYKQPIINFVYRMLRDEAEAEDVAQNTFVQAYNAAERYSPSAKFSTWLFTIARRLCLNEIRRRSRHPAESMDAPYPGEENQPAQELADPRAVPAPEAVLQSELQDKVEAALDSLPENQREAMLLCRQEDLSYEEIAQVLGCSLSATKSLIFRARETLKARLKGYLRTGAWTSK